MTKQIGKSTVIWNNQGAVFTCLTAELEVAAKQLFGDKPKNNN
jgi:hypothetical protein